jgi:phosphoribosylformylglycinamidine cyclo-ligase
LPENLPRVLPAGCRAEVATDSWQWPEIFSLLQRLGNVETTEMYRTFNCGVGMVLCVPQQDAGRTITLLESSGHRAWELGGIVDGERGVEFKT